MAATIPDDPFGLTPQPPFRPSARRELRVFGAPADLTWLPERRSRAGAPTASRPPFDTSPIERILAEETLWRGPDCALTPNRYPIAAGEVLLWATQPVRELSIEILQVALDLEAAANGTLMVNSVGAAASIARAHLHLVSERLPFLPSLPREPIAPAYLDGHPEVKALRLAAPFPAVAVGLVGPVRARAQALHHLLELRTAAAYNVVSQDGETWTFPRSGVEIPAPYFPQALGAAELWGRWCFADRDAFERATEQDLERAIAVSGCQLP